MKFELHHTADLGATFSPSAQYLFNDSRHLPLQANKGWHVFEYQEVKTKRLRARISFVIKSGEARSPARAPFGSIEFYRKLTEKQVFDFVELIKDKLVKLGVKKITIGNYPDLYNATSANILRSSLINSGFDCADETSSIILIDGKSFESKIKISERQKLKKAALEFEFEQGRTAELKKLYEFIDFCRKERDQSLSMTLPELIKLVSVFPDRVLFFKVGSKTEISAAAIVIQVSKKVLYTFYYAHSRIHNRVSPVVFLLSGIYDFSARRKFSMIDLGTSMTAGEVNRSLLHFKKSIGGVTTTKSTFTKVL